MNQIRVFLDSTWSQLSSAVLGLGLGASEL
jgi:hypothetical protein